jgi:DNA-binding transcriptional MerR regulator
MSDVATACGIPVSTLRYYDEIGLVPTSHRRSRVRHYDRAALEQLAYVQLWRVDGMLSIEHTRAMVASENRERRNELLRHSRDELADRVRRLREAEEMLTHLMKCPRDDHVACPVTRAYLDDRVDTALARLTGRAGPSRPAAQRTEPGWKVDCATGGGMAL